MRDDLRRMGRVAGMLTMIGGAFQIGAAVLPRAPVAEVGSPGASTDAVGSARDRAAPSRHMPRVGPESANLAMHSVTPGGEAVLVQVPQNAAARIAAAWIRDGVSSDVDAELGPLSGVERSRLIRRIEIACIEASVGPDRTRHIGTIERLLGSASRSVREDAASSLANVAVTAPFQVAPGTLVDLVSDRELDPRVVRRVARATVTLCGLDASLRIRIQDLIAGSVASGRIDARGLEELRTAAAASRDEAIRTWGRSLGTTPEERR